MRLAIESAWKIKLEDDSSESRDHFADHCFCVLESLIEMQDTAFGISDADVSLNFTEMMVTYSFEIEAANLDACISQATVAMRSSVHAAKGFTATWDEHALQLKFAVVDDNRAAPTLTFAS